VFFSDCCVCLTMWRCTWSGVGNNGHFFFQDFSTAVHIFHLTEKKHESKNVPFSQQMYLSSFSHVYYLPEKTLYVRIKWFALMGIFQLFPTNMSLNKK
jgi:hypothetical protein